MAQRAGAYQSKPVLLANIFEFYGNVTHLFFFPKLNNFSKV
jgi:hypothetical protein